VIQHVTEAGAALFETLNGESLGGMVNGSQMKLYKEDQSFVH
jgi:hypothetical protein